MKQRLGFVSNSSSSSYVAIGVKISEGEIEQIGDILNLRDKEHNYVDPGSVEYELRKRGIDMTFISLNPSIGVIGWGSDIDDYSSNEEESYQTISSEIKDQIHKMDIYLPGLSDREIKIYTGNYMS